ncbi:MAG: ClpXP protease specificity-enhancing factor [Porticoccaceae bacterium]
MNSNQPYLLQAFYSWIVDNDCTPYVLVDANYPQTSVPQQHVSDGQIVLNIAPRAVSAFHIDLEGIAFHARFGGVPTDIYLPAAAIMSIYAQENGQGIVFERPSEPTPPPRPTAVKRESSSERVKKTDRPSLRVVK